MIIGEMNSLGVIGFFCLNISIWFLIHIYFLQSLRTETALVQKPVVGTESNIAMKQMLAFTFTEQVYLSGSFCTTDCKTDVTTT
jgi:hypothetical protein